MAEPNNLAVIDDIEMASGMTVEAFFAPQVSIDVILDKLYGKKSTMEAAEALGNEVIAVANKIIG